MTVDVNKMTKRPLPLYLIEKCFPRIQSFQKCSYIRIMFFLEKKNGAENFVKFFWNEFYDLPELT